MQLTTYDQLLEVCQGYPLDQNIVAFFSNESAGCKVTCEKEELMVKLFGRLTQRERDDYIRILEKICNILEHVKK